MIGVIVTTVPSGTIVPLPARTGSASMSAGVSSDDVLAWA